jgi:hypothetical protein
VATLNQLRAGLATNLRTIAGLRVYEEIPDNPQFPAAIVVLNSADYDRNFGGMTLYNFQVQVIVGRAAERAAQRALDLYIEPEGTSSVKAGVESNRTMSGIAQDTYLANMPNIGSVIINDVTYLAADFLVAVYA